MERFELLDILTQDKHGVVYVAWDSVLGRKVTIRRFLPFGQNGGGLVKEEAVAFESASKRLSELQHEGLRSVMFGGVDPIDSIPYLVNEWVDGVSLESLLEDEPMEPALVIDVLRIALEMSVILSQVLGEDAVWVETEANAIFVGAEGTGRGFTFWISPFKWLGGEQQSRRLSSIVALGEELTGWKKKLVSDSAGYGLGGWLKWLKRNPDVSLSEAIESLASSTGQKPAADSFEEAPVQKSPQPSVPALKSTSSKLPIFIAATLAILLSLIALINFNRDPIGSETGIETIKSKEPDASGPVSPEDQSAPPEEIASGEVVTTVALPSVPPIPVNSATARVNALAIELQRKAAENSQKSEEKKTVTQESTNHEKVEFTLPKQKRNLGAERQMVRKRGGFLTPDQADLIRTYGPGAPIKLKGVLKGVRLTETGKTIYLNFADPEDFALTNGALHERDFQGSFSEENFSGFIGKSVMINGELFIDTLKKAYFVKITSMKQIYSSN